MGHGVLDHIDPAWTGWRLDRGELVSPEGWTFTPGAVRAGELYRRQMLEYGQHMRAQRMALEADPVNRAGIQRLAVLQAALECAMRAMDEITSRLTPLERNRLFGSAADSGRDWSHRRGRGRVQSIEPAHPAVEPDSDRAEHDRGVARFADG